MNKIILIILLFLLSGCASLFPPQDKAAYLADAAKWEKYYSAQEEIAKQNKTVDIIVENGQIKEIKIYSNNQVNVINPE